MSDSIFRIEMLPARQGDALWIEYGDPDHPSRVLVDAGTRGTYPVVKARAAQVDDLLLDLFVVTHVDSDHIGGAPKLVVDHELDLQAREVWFNGRDQIERARLGPVEGEILSEAIRRRGWPLNPQFEDGIAVVPAAGPLPTATLAGGMTITLLSPTPDKLEALRPVWLDVVEEAGLLDGDAAVLEEAARRRGVTLGAIDVEKLARRSTPTDTAPANGSTIAFLAEVDGISCLFAGDAHPDTLVSSLRILLRDRGLRRLPLSALKVPHHGSQHNVTNELAELVDARTYLFSTDGTQTDHPHEPAVARILLAIERDAEAELVFNYRTAFNEVWDDPALERRWHYHARFPGTGTAGISVDLAPV